jgi:DNA-binding XRE family transcriptional regulator
MTTLRDIREEHYISRRTLADLAGVSESTIVRIEDPRHKTRYDVAEKVIAAVNLKTGLGLKLENIEGLNLYNVMRDRRQRKKNQESTSESGSVNPAA